MGKRGPIACWGKTRVRGGGGIFILELMGRRRIWKGVKDEVAGIRSK